MPEKSEASDFGSRTEAKLSILRTALGFDGGFSVPDLLRVLPADEMRTYELIKHLASKGWLTMEQVTVRPRTKGGSAVAKVYTFTDRGRQLAQEILGTPK